MDQENGDKHIKAIQQRRPARKQAYDQQGSTDQLSGHQGYGRDIWQGNSHTAEHSGHPGNMHNGQLLPTMQKESDANYYTQNRKTPRLQTLISHKRFPFSY